MQTVEPLILELTPGGLPARWINVRHAAELTYTDKVLWGLGEVVTLRGGHTGTGEQSTLDVQSIIAVNDGALRMERGMTPILTNRELFRRDNNICLYCGGHFVASKLTRDHVVPTSKGGPNTWCNVVTCCSPCNHHKGDRTPEKAGLKLLAVPYVPSIAEAMLLKNRRVLFDQMDYLMKLIPEGRREKYENWIN